MPIIKTRRPFADSLLWRAGCLLAALGIFWADSLTPLGFAHGSLYILLILPVALFNRARFLLILSGVTIVLTLAGIFISPPGIEMAYVISNRLFSVLEIALITAASIVVRRQLRELRATTAALKHSQATVDQQRALIEVAASTAHIGGWSVTLPDEQILWSDYVCQLHGQPPGYRPKTAEAIDYYAPEWRDEIRRHMHACLAGLVEFDQEAELLATNGTRRWVRVCGRSIRDPQGKVVRIEGSLQDITADKETQSTLLRLAERRINILENITDAFMTIDKDWCFTYVNKEAERVLQRRREDLLGKYVWDLFADAANFEVHYRRALAEQTSVAFEDYYAALGKWFDVRALPAEDGLVVYFRDVTSRHIRIEEMRIARERFEILAKATTDAVWDWDINSDHIWWNDSMFTLFGYTPAELEPDSRSWTSHIHPDDKDRVMDSVARAISGIQQEWQDEYRFCRRDGSYAYVIDKGFILRDPDGKALRMVGGMMDITETKLLQERLAQSQRLEALGQLTGGVAHDFNNLLTVILGNGELLAEQLEQHPDQFPLIDLINQAAVRASQLTRHLLAFARRQPLAPQATDIRKLIGGMESMIRRSLMANLEIELVHAAGLWAALVDAAQLESALLNLCLNGRDAMPNGGRLTIETGNIFLDESYAALHGEVQPGQYVMIAVSDTGSGIEPDTLLHVFDPFFTTKEPGRGTGLGLSMVYGFVKQSRGHIKIYTELEQGTTVRMYLPRALEARAEDSVKVTPVLRGGNAKVLLVEDDAMVSMYARHLLLDLGYQVLSASNGRDALGIIEQTPDIALLFTDVIMPGGMNGRQLADAACGIRPGLKVLFTSGYTENAIVHHGRLDPGVHLLSKPYQRKDLVGKLLQVLGDPR